MTFTSRNALLIPVFFILSSCGDSGSSNPNPAPAAPVTSAPVATPAPAQAATTIPAAPIASATPAPDIEAEPVLDASGVVVKTYVGEAEFHGSAGRELRDITLSVSRDPSGTVRVAYRVTSSGVGADFHSCAYDPRRRLLIAREPMKIGSLAGELRLSCQNYSFDETSYDFACDYESTTADVVGDFTFKSTQR